MTTDTTIDDPRSADATPTGAPPRATPTPARATAVAGAILFTDMLLQGLAIPVLPLLPAVAEWGAAATGVLLVCVYGSISHCPGSRHRRVGFDCHRDEGILYSDRKSVV